MTESRIARRCSASRRDSTNPARCFGLRLPMRLGSAPASAPHRSRSQQRSSLQRCGSWLCGRGPRVAHRCGLLRPVQLRGQRRQQCCAGPAASTPRGPRPTATAVASFSGLAAARSAAMDATHCAARTAARNRPAARSSAPAAAARPAAPPLLQPAAPCRNQPSAQCTWNSPCCSGTVHVARQTAVAAAQPVLQWHSPCCSPCCSGSARVAAAQPVMQWHSPCCSGTGRAAVAQPVKESQPELQLHNLGCSGRVAVTCVAVAQPWHSPCCSCTAHIAAANPCCSGTALLQWHSLCYSSAAAAKV